MSKEVDTYKIFRELEAREKRANPYKFYDKDELIDEILKNEDEIERLNNIIKQLEKYIEESYKYNSKCLSTIFEARAFEDNKILDKLQELKGSENNE